MTHAYNKYYLDDAMRNLGEAFDYVANICNLQLDEFIDMFIASGLAKQFGNGVAKYVSGMSGMELVLEIADNLGMAMQPVEISVEYECSPEYWCGWILAYYQWYTGVSFKSIKQHISMKEILKLYPVLHEASEDKLVDTLNLMIMRDDNATR